MSSFLPCTLHWYCRRPHPEVFGSEHSSIFSRPRAKHVLARPLKPPRHNVGSSTQNGQRFAFHARDPTHPPLTPRRHKGHLPRTSCLMFRTQASILSRSKSYPSPLTVRWRRRLAPRSNPGYTLRRPNPCREASADLTTARQVVPGPREGLVVLCKRG